VHALDIGAVDAALLFFVDAAGVEEEQPSRVLAGVEQALGARVDVDAARRVAGTDQVRVAVPDVRRVEAFPGRAYQLVVGEMPRKLRQTGIP
jgi:hypothetical protein